MNTSAGRSGQIGGESAVETWYRVMVTMRRQMFVKYRGTCDSAKKAIKAKSIDANESVRTSVDSSSSCARWLRTQNNRQATTKEKIKNKNAVKSRNTLWPWFGWQTSERTKEVEKKRKKQNEKSLNNRKVINWFKVWNRTKIKSSRCKWSSIDSASLNTSCKNSTSSLKKAAAKQSVQSVASVKLSEGKTGSNNFKDKSDNHRKGRNDE